MEYKVYKEQQICFKRKIGEIFLQMCSTNRSFECVVGKTCFFSLFFVVLVEGVDGTGVLWTCVYDSFFFLFFVLFLFVYSLLISFPSLVMLLYFLHFLDPLFLLFFFFVVSSLGYYILFIFYLFFRFFFIIIIFCFCLLCYCWLLLFNIYDFILLQNPLKPWKERRMMDIWYTT